MGIYDRDYTQAEEDSGPGGWGGFLQGHTAVKVLILANALVFIAWIVDDLALRGFLSNHFTLQPSEVLGHFRFHTLLTATFSHQDFWHLLWNMLFLAWFGADLEDGLYGARNLAWLYLAAGLAASLAYVGAEVLMHRDAQALGASGAVMGIVVVCACFYPDRPIYFFGLFPIPLKWFAGFYILGDILGLANRSPDGVAHAAHLGGALAGFLFYKLDLRVFAIREQRRTSFLERLKGAFRRKPNLKVVERPASARMLREPEPEPRSSQKLDFRTAARVDELLRKISAQGIGALTDEEREFLKASSQKYKRGSS